MCNELSASNAAHQSIQSIEIFIIWHPRAGRKSLNSGERSVLGGGKRWQQKVIGKMRFPFRLLFLLFLLFFFCVAIDDITEILERRCRAISIKFIVFSSILRISRCFKSAQLLLRTTMSLVRFCVSFAFIRH